jgi:N-acyl-D-aspartate/D-glutamate deacylase
MPLETMVRKVTGLAAKRMRLPGKGRIGEGYDADLVLFSPEKIRDEADYLHSTRLSQGIERVIVNGVTGYRAGKMTRARAGRFIRHQG